MIKYIISFVLSLLMIIAPENQITRLVRWAGCNAEIITSDEHSVFESFFLMNRNQLFIGTQPMDGVSRDMEMVVIFHEAAHCLQHQADPEGFAIAYSEDPKTFELAADREGARLMCSMHLDGPKATHDTLVWAYRNFGYRGDPEHGTLAERMHQADNLDTCQKVNEAP